MCEEVASRRVKLCEEEQCLFHTEGVKVHTRGVTGVCLESESSVLRGCEAVWRGAVWAHIAGVTVHTSQVEFEQVWGGFILDPAQNFHPRCIMGRIHTRRVTCLSRRVVRSVTETAFGHLHWLSVHC